MDVSLALGVSIYVIKLFTKKLDERDNYIKNLVDNFLRTTQKFVTSQEQMVSQLESLNMTMKELQEDLDKISEKLTKIEIRKI